ncbi:class A beta-lactamase [Chitinophaga sp. Mgbs1]|uniref:Beta-lactamase n=1 Tax=Chitinophaga solisilvae TaxID=1233460 RepID=A0A433WLE2_9BACT|nr:class A beta-lactamase [Chitinophaga solisilvae]
MSGIFRLFYCLLLGCCGLSVSAQQSPLVRAYATIASGIKGTVGISSVVLETGAAAGLRTNEHFPMQSVYKFPIAMAVLHEVDKGRLSLQQPVRVLPSDLIPKNGHSPLRDAHPAGNVDYSIAELLRLNVAESDGTACDVLLRLLGGPEKAGQYVHSLGITDISIATTEQVQVPDEMVQYRNWSTPAAMTALLRKFYTGKGTLLSDSSYHFLLHLMVTSTPGAKRLKGLLPKDAIVAHKTGTSGTTGNLTRATNDAGIITLPNGHHLLISVFVKDARADLAQREATIARIAEATWKAYTK